MMLSCPSHIPESLDILKQIIICFTKKVKIYSFMWYFIQMYIISRMFHIPISIIITIVDVFLSFVC